MKNPEISDPVEHASQRLRTQALLVWGKEARTLSWFGLQDGMSVLELGSGPGYITEQLLTLLSRSPVTALEINPAFIAKAKQLLRGKGNDRLEFVQASVMDTGLPENSQDFAIARFLFQHLPDPVGAAKEVWRVLKPGGKLVIIDSDDGLVGIVDPPLTNASDTMAKFGKVQSAKGGNRLVGRHLVRILKAAGFVGAEIEIVVAHSDALGLDPFLPQLSPDRLTSLVKAGLMSEQDIETARSQYNAFLSSENPLIMMLMLMACGTKPRS